MAERGPTRRTGRRGLLAGIAGVGASVLLAACGAPPAPTTTPAPAAKAEPAAKAVAETTAPATKAEAPAAAAPSTKAKTTELNLVWSGWILNANPVVNELAGEYAQQTGVKVVVSTAPQDLLQKLLLEAKQGKSTWGGWEGHTAHDVTAQLVEGDALAPWDPYVTDDERKDFLATSWEEQKYKGKAYSIPYRVSPTVMIYRPSLLEKLGFKEFPSSWDGVYEVCAKAVKDLSEPSKKMNGIVFTSSLSLWGHWAILATLVAKPFDTEKGMANLDIPEAVEAFRMMQRLYSYSSPDILSTPIQDVTQAGLSVIHMQHLLQAQRMKPALQGDVKVTRMPRTPKSEGTTYESSGVDILKHYGQHDEVASFWLWLSKQKKLYDSLWVKNGSPPNRRSLWKQFEPLKGKEIDAASWDVDEMQAKSQGIPISLWKPIQDKHTRRVTPEFLLGKIPSPEAAVAEIKRATEEDVAKQKS